jgi:hypothetical protein
MVAVAVQSFLQEWVPLGAPKKRGLNTDARYYSHGLLLDPSLFSSLNDFCDETTKDGIRRRKEKGDLGKCQKGKGDATQLPRRP